MKKASFSDILGQMRIFLNLQSAPCFSLPMDWLRLQQFSSSFFPFWLFWFSTPSNLPLTFSFSLFYPEWGFRSTELSPLTWEETQWQREREQLAIENQSSRCLVINCSKAVFHLSCYFSLSCSLLLCLLGALSYSETSACISTCLQVRIIKDNSSV